MLVGDPVLMKIIQIIMIIDISLLKISLSRSTHHLFLFVLKLFPYLFREDFIISPNDPDGCWGKFCRSSVRGWSWYPPSLVRHILYRRA